MMWVKRSGIGGTEEILRFFFLFSLQMPFPENGARNENVVAYAIVSIFLSSRFQYNVVRLILGYRRPTRYCSRCQTKANECMYLFSTNNARYKYII